MQKMLNTFCWVESKSAGLIDVFGDEVFARPAVDGADPDDAKAGVCEVQVSSQRIDSHVFRHPKRLVHDDPKQSDHMFK